jgi:hypothetical protein
MLCLNVVFKAIENEVNQLSSQMVVELILNSLRAIILMVLVLNPARRRLHFTLLTS